MFRNRRLREEIAYLREANEQLRRRAEKAEEKAATEEFARKTITRQFAETDAANLRLASRNEHLTRLLEDARKAQAEQAGLVRAQQAQLDELLGMDHPDVNKGASWQERRPDKPKPAPVAGQKRAGAAS